MSAGSRVRSAWLVSRYPDVSHTFILREVLALKSRGREVATASINDPPPLDRLTAVEREQATQTFYIKRQGAFGVLRAAAFMLVRRPAATLAAFFYALQLGGIDPRRAVFAVFYYAEALVLARWMMQRGLDHLHVHFATPGATVALIVKRLTGARLSITVHGPDEFFDVKENLLAEKIAAADFIICISYFAQSQLMKLVPSSHWGKFEIARLGVDLMRFSARPPEMPPRTNGSDHPFAILCVGRLVAAKGQAILLAAVAQLLEQGRPVRLTLVGDGPERSALETEATRFGIATSIVFAGAVNQDRIGEFYRATDVFALASFAEGIPVVLMEAMAMEIPCIATRIAGIAELIEDGVTGLLVAPSDVAGMAEAIARLMDSAALREELGRAGRQRVEREYELGASANRLNEILNRRLGEAGA